MSIPSREELKAARSKKPTFSIGVETSSESDAQEDIIDAALNGLEEPEKAKAEKTSKVEEERVKKSVGRPKKIFEDTYKFSLNIPLRNAKYIRAATFLMGKGKSASDYINSLIEKDIAENEDEYANIAKLID